MIPIGQILLVPIFFALHADFAEPTREYKEAVQVRKLAEMELDQAVHNVARYKIDFLLQKGWIIHPNTILAYNSTLVNTTL